MSLHKILKIVAPDICTGLSRNSLYHGFLSDEPNKFKKKKQSIDSVVFCISKLVLAIPTKLSK